MARKEVHWLCGSYLITINNSPDIKIKIIHHTLASPLVFITIIFLVSRIFPNLTFLSYFTKGWKSKKKSLNCSNLNKLYSTDEDRWPEIISTQPKTSLVLVCNFLYYICSKTVFSLDYFLKFKSRILASELEIQIQPDPTSQTFTINWFPSLPILGGISVS